MSEEIVGRRRRETEWGTDDVGRFTSEERMLWTGYGAEITRVSEVDFFRRWILYQ